MNSITKEMEQMHILNDMGAGLLNQLYFVKVQLIANEQYALVSDAVLGKVRLKLEKKFPAHPDLAKVCKYYFVLLDCTCAYMIFFIINNPAQIYTLSFTS